ncbi:breast cancer anti-estrogen resistance protein 1-like isoform X1 [Amphibalanus amphitrite]|uniref:breast cancer anti-estrogen resistance protein 1-like isoform X1 n=2 Tax=Amphibalanus amphitrite TaxID=1232801 RepID=UPI001C90021A|nr:breast cancer anti-estrogen resistance protein 1-like isoform X1 [Amphibalanus amphitrite]
MNTFPRSESKKKWMALAMFDNLADSPDELSFRRGDTLTVVEQNTGGLQGWWLCSFRGRQGIVPGNRLQLLEGVYDPAQAAKVAAQMHGTTGRFRRSWSPNAKNSPMNQSTASLPRPSRAERLMRQYSGDTYDSPPAPVSVVSAAQEDYDTPRAHRVPPPPPPASAKPRLTAGGGGATALYSAPASNRCSAVSITSAGSSTRSSSGSSSNRSSLEQAPEATPLRRPPGIPENGRLSDASEGEEYDIPRRIGPTWPTEEQDTYDVPPSRPAARGSRNQVDDAREGETYDFPPPRTRTESRDVRVSSPQETQSRLRLDSGDTYDIPPPPTGRLAELELSDSSAARGETETDSPNDTLDTIDTYDYPRPAHDVYDYPHPSGGQDVNDSPRGGQDVFDSPRGGQDVYDAPRARQDVYDSPHGGQDVYDSPRGGQDVYDFPRAAQESYSSPRPELDIYDSPRAPSVTTPRRGAAAASFGSRDSLQSSALSHRASTVSEASVGSGSSEVVLRSERSRTGTASRNATYWLRSAGSGGSSALSGFGEPRELPLDTDAGLETVARLDQEVTAALDRLFAAVAPSSRAAAHMEASAVDLKLTVMRLRTALHELIQFAYGAMVATTRGPEQRIGSQFVHVLRPLEETARLIDSAAETQERAGWSAAALRRQNAPSDALSQLVACAQSLRGDVRQVVAFVRGNAALVFRRRASVLAERGASPPSGPRAGLMGDYDYVCLQTSGSLAEEGDEVRSRLPEELRGSFDNLMKESQVPVGDRVDANDHQVIEFYRGQTECHHAFLNNAIDALFQTIQNNQPPKVFVAHSKFVILSAHKLVYIGDTVHRNVVHAGVRRDALAAADALFATLRRTVQSTKTAALQFPSAHAVQEMADAVLDVSRAAEDLKLVMDEAVL